MRTLVSNKWKFLGASGNKLCFSSRIYEDEVLLCGAPCKYVDSTTGNVAIIRTSGSELGCYEAEWTHATVRKEECGFKHLKDVYDFVNTYVSIVSSQV